MKLKYIVFDLWPFFSNKQYTQKRSFKVQQFGIFRQLERIWEECIVFVCNLQYFVDAVQGKVISKSENDPLIDLEGDSNIKNKLCTAVKLKFFYKLFFKILHFLQIPVQHAFKNLSHTHTHIQFINMRILYQPSHLLSV